MIEEKQHNPEMNLAWQYIEGTHVSVFLTGKAGTGKTTFLKKIRELSPKRMVVVAPTGVAAINAQGVTIHSFFQLPIGVHLPGMQRQEGNNFYQFSKEKKNIFRTLDLLVIDEISMVRADLLDAIDSVLRTYRDRTQPFGGVQLLLIGDLQQLAPVAVEKEWAMLKDYYDSPYFFSSKALQQISYVTIELKHIYRQSDEHFIQLLANVREGRLDADTVNALNTRYIANYEPDENQGCIRLTTHNYMAQRYNEQKLQSIHQAERHFTCEVKGEFPENSYPADADLTLKVGAQVMFIKNDPSPDHAFYNGKIGRVVGFSDGGIMVKCPEDQHVIVVDQLSWENTKVTINEETKEIQEEVIGIFKQVPLRLAWAITIHKSQGLTFDHAILDINDSFAHGQVYVALSRCRTLEGMVLSQPINVKSLAVDESVNRFISSEQQKATHALEQLSGMRQEYFKTLLNELFDFRRNYEQMARVYRIYEEDLYRSNPELTQQWSQALKDFASNIMEVSLKFKEQYTRMLAASADYQRNPLLQERIAKGSQYFSDQLHTFDTLLANTPTIGNQAVKKKYANAFDPLKMDLTAHLRTLEKTVEHGFSVRTYLRDKAFALLDEQPEEKKKPKRNTTKLKNEKTWDASLRYYQQGMSVEQIAKLRELTPETIFSHLSRFIPDGIVDAHRIIPPSHLQMVRAIIHTEGWPERDYYLQDRLPKYIGRNELKIILQLLRKA